MVNEEYKEIFLSEAKEHTDSLNSLLVTLEKNNCDQETLNKIFRVFHTLKGNSATMGYEIFSKLAHKLEDLLDMLRNNKLTIDKSIMDILFEGCDLLEEGIEKIEQNEPESLDTGSILEKINNVNPTGSKNEKESKVTMITDKVEFTKEEEKEITGIEKDEIKRIVIEFEDNPLKVPKAMSIIRKIEENKENKIIRINPDKKQISTNFGTKLEIIVHTKKEKDIENLIKLVTKIKNHAIFSLNESYEQHTKEMNKAEIIKTHNEELKKVQEVRIDIKRLDNLMDMVGELLICKMRLENINRTMESKDLEEITNAISLLTESIQNEVIEERMIPVGMVFSRLPRIVRDLSLEEGKEIEFIMEGDDKKLDRTVIDKITDPLVHMIRNSVDHGIETPEIRLKAGKERKGRIKLTATREKNSVVIEVEDNGKGIDPVKIKEVAIKKGTLPLEELNAMSDERLQELVFLPGFSTNEKVTEVSGRGVGMDVVMTNIKEIGGEVYLFSKKGEGARVRIELPLTVAIISVLIVNVNNEKYAIPLTNIHEIIDITKDQIKTIQGRETFILRGENLALFRIKKLIGAELSNEEKLTVIIVENRKNMIGLVVDGIESQQQILIKNVDEKIKKIKGIAGGTILGDGKVCFILDIDSLIISA